MSQTTLRRWILFGLVLNCFAAFWLLKYIGQNTQYDSFHTLVHEGRWNEYIEKVLLSGLDRIRTHYAIVGNVMDFLLAEKRRRVVLLSTLSIITVSFLLAFVWNMWKNINRQRILYAQVNESYCQNRIPTTNFSDPSFTRSEILKLMQTPEYIALTESRKGKGPEAWNWQKRKDRENFVD
ncbi:hypothetical protein IE077_000940 [Cardiosporidium cionae]|uniref:Uncharacterized protein n=1 Tax=Cardiosporidium cionae TaxID=476202 RepID=A0ABQ7JDN6_9APIC|nr:hypothetical protein IE077_000940 [Cardiosporidium cionae]|eukprot:KAF8822127.1 hypothetical protein IE077_000940 [Cardiosporidium cionae]